MDQKTNVELENAEEMLGDDLDSSYNPSLAKQQQDKVIEDSRSELEDLGQDVEELKAETPVFPAEEEEQQAEQDEPVGYPLPPKEDFDLEESEEKLEEALSRGGIGNEGGLGFHLYNKFKSDPENDYTDEQIDQMVEETLVRARVGMLNVDDFDVETAGVQMISRNPTPLIKKMAYDAEVLSMQKESNLYEHFVGTLGDLNAASMMKASDLVDQGVADLSDEFLDRVEELKKEGITDREARIKVGVEFTKKKKPFLSLKITEQERQQREKLGPLGTDTARDVLSFGAGGALAKPAASAAYKAATSAFAATPGPGKVKAAAGIFAGGFAGLSAFLMGFAGFRSAYALRTAGEDAPIDDPIFNVAKTFGGAYEVAKSAGDQLIVFDEIYKLYELMPLHYRAQFTTGVVNTAVEFGLASKIANSPSLQKFINTGISSLQETQEDLNRDRSASEVVIETLVSPDLLNNSSSKILRVLYHPAVQKEFQDALRYSGLSEKNIEKYNYIVKTSKEVNDFLGYDEGYDVKKALSAQVEMIVDILNEIKTTDGFRRQQDLERMNEIRKVSDLLEDETRKKRTNYNDDIFYKTFRKFEENPDKFNDADKTATIKGYIDSQSWSEANQDWRGKMPDVDQFKAFVRSHYEAGFPDPNTDNVILYSAFITAIDDKPNKVVQSHLNKIPLGMMAAFSEGLDKPVWTRPSDKEMEKFALDLLKYKNEERGQKSARIVQERGLLPAMYNIVDDKGYDALVEPGRLHKAYQFITLLDNIVAEADIAVDVPEYLVPFVQKVGLPRTLGTPAGVDFALNIGLRANMPNYWARVRAGSKTVSGGSQIGYEEIQLARGFNRSDLEFAWSLFGMGIDFAPKEIPIIKGGVRAALRGANRFNLSKNALYKSASGQAKSSLKNLEVGGGVRHEKTSDPSLEYFQATKAALLQELVEGRNPARFLEPAEKDILDDAALAVDINPEHLFAALFEATGDSNHARKISQAVLREVGDNDYMVLRASPAYKALETNLNNLVKNGVIKPEYAQTILSGIEYHAIMASKQSDVFKSPSEVLRNTAISYNKPPGLGINPTVRVMHKGPDGFIDTLTNRPGIPKGYFEFDARTNRSILNFFEKGDLDTVWRMEGTFMTHIMGQKFRNKFFRYFDHEYDTDGRVQLTAIGQGQFSEAWKYYRRTSDHGSGYVRRLFDELWIGLHNFWSKIRRKPGLLPEELKIYWDLEFGQLPQERRMVQTVSAGGLTRKQRRASKTVEYDNQGNVKNTDIGAEDVRRSRAAMANDLGYDETTIRSLLGHRKSTTIRNVFDESTQTSRRVVEQKYLPREYDAVDAALSLIALIKTAPFRKRLAGKSYSSVGTKRYQVLDSLSLELEKRVYARLTGALGKPVKELIKSIFQPKRDGTNALSDPSKYPAGVVDADVRAFADRMESLNPGSNGLELAQKETFIVLTNRQEAGFKTLIEELSYQPESNHIPLQMMDPSANLKIVSVKEFNSVQNVLIDIEATPLNRRSRNTIDPGLRDSVTSVFRNKKVIGGVARVFDKLSKAFGSRPVLSKESYEPLLVQEMNSGARRLGNLSKELLEISDQKEYSAAKTVEQFFAQRGSASVSPIAIDDLDFLQNIVRRIDGSIARMEKRAGAKVDQATGTSNKNIAAILYDAESESISIESMASSIGMIQRVLGGVFGMTETERQSINTLRMVAQLKRVNRSFSDLNPDEQALVTDAVHRLILGLKEKHDYVVNTGKQIAERGVAVQDISKYAFGTASVEEIYYKNYKAYYTGDFKYVTTQPDSVMRLDVSGVKTGSARDPRRVTYTTETYLLALRNFMRNVFQREIASDLPPPQERMISVLIFMKMDEEQRSLARSLVEKGYGLSRREIANTMKLSGEISTNHEKYVDRVVFYVNRAMQLSDWVLFHLDKNGNTKKRLFPSKPAKDDYGVAETPSRLLKGKRADETIVSNLDLTAQHEARQIIARSGMRAERGQMVDVFIGDRKFVLPKTMHDFLEDYQLKTFPNAAFKKEWSDEGKSQYRLAYDLLKQDQLGRAAGTLTEKALKDVYATSVTVTKMIFSPTAFYSGLLIGSGGLPMIGYGIGVFVGGMSQLHLGSGMRSVIRDLVQGPLILGETLAGQAARGAADIDIPLPLTKRRLRLTEGQQEVVNSLADSLQSRTSFTAGVLARLHGRNAAIPETKPLILSDGRIFTADMIANSVKDYGWRSAMVDAFQNPGVLSRWHEKFSQDNPTATLTPIGTLLGLATTGFSPLGAALGGAGGLTLGQILKPGNIFTKTHRFYRESFSAIDTFLRIKILTEELEKGRSLESAARKVRDVALDYSNLSDAEISFFARFFAFYTYFSQAMKLFVESIGENPQRVLNQIKFILKSQQQYTEGRDPTGIVSDWDLFRGMLPFKIGGETYRLPFLLSGDSLALLMELYGTIPILNPENKIDNIRKILSRTNPIIPIAIKGFYDVDPSRGTRLGRSGFQVDSNIITMDTLLTGGNLYDALNVKYIDPDNIKMSEEDKKKLRFSRARIEHPGRGVYISQNRALHLFLFDYFQSPITGRMGDNLQALERGNVNALSTVVDGLEYLKEEYSPDRPLLSHVGALTAIGLVRDKDPTGLTSLDDPLAALRVDPNDPRYAKSGQSDMMMAEEQRVTASIELLRRQGLVKTIDGVDYADTGKFYFAEVGRVLGHSRMKSLDSAMDRTLAFVLKDKIREASEQKSAQSTAVEMIETPARQSPKPD